MNYEYNSLMTRCYLSLEENFNSKRKFTLYYCRTVLFAVLLHILRLILHGKQH